MSIYRFVTHFQEQNDPRSGALLQDAHALGFTDLTRIECQDLYFIEGQLNNDQLQQLALELLCDPVTQEISWDEFPAPVLQPEPGVVMVEVALRHGVTDPVADEIVRAARQLGISGVRSASTGRRYLIDTDEETGQTLATRLLANMVVHRWAVGEVEPSFPVMAEASEQTETIKIRGLGDQELLEVSKERRAALDLREMQAIQHYCDREARDLTDVEFEAIAQTWSEHCVHKTFKGRITFEDGRVVDSIYQTYIRAVTEKIEAPWVLSAFVDNAGIIDLDGENEVSFKVETHNHPSAIEPFGGANTGVGGVIRDVLGVSHKPVANTDVLCFGLQETRLSDLPSGVLHPRLVMSGVVAGVQDYGNKIGIPTVNGAILFDPGYAANPLVFCGTVGISPIGLHQRTPKKGDRVIVLGGGTGRDGLRGATFSSMTMDAQTGEVSGSSVQIGNPIVEKGLVDVIIPARDQGLYTAITDCGAGGLSSAVGEMASGIGADVDLTDVRLKYPGLAPWEIWLSEAQERMVLAVPRQDLPKLQELCDTYGVHLTDIGAFTGSGRLVVRCGEKVVLDLANEFLHEGIPQRELKAAEVKVRHDEAGNLSTKYRGTASEAAGFLLKLLAHPNIASKERVIRMYDHEVQGGTAVKPLTGAENDGPSDAAVIHPLGARGRAGVAIAAGINPEYGKLDAYRMALSVVDEAVRNAVAVGADPERIAILDNFCWGDPLRPEILGSVVEAARGCHDAALMFGTPLISGKDSFNNEYLGVDGLRHAIPPTLLISSIGILDDVDKSVTMDLKEAGNPLYLVGEFQPVFGGAHFNRISDWQVNEPAPSLAASTPYLYRSLHQAIKKGLVRSCHDLSEGGLAVAAAEICIAGRLGLDIDMNTDDPLRWLFGETNGCLLVEVDKARLAAFEALFSGLSIERIAIVTEAPELKVSLGTGYVFNLPVDQLLRVWKTPLQP
ncbi:MAG: phosphoribosylformylglycinamidine synthase subunit PurL [Anaerolineales bacterium]|nr:phosphoribosylformylglycinamidine synthase subunit PurL [Anaerolineales bacterium]